MEELFTYIIVVVIAGVAGIESVRQFFSKRKQKQIDEVRGYYEETEFKEQQEMEDLFDFDEKISR